jgi:hypothetical protein
MPGICREHASAAAFAWFLDTEVVSRLHFRLLVSIQPAHVALRGPLLHSSTSRVLSTWQQQGPHQVGHAIQQAVH